MNSRILQVAAAPETAPEAPPAEPETRPEPGPAPPERKPDLDPFNPDWPAGRPEPQPKALRILHGCVTSRSGVEAIHAVGVGGVGHDVATSLPRGSTEK
jgi:hypothetical protein